MGRLLHIYQTVRAEGVRQPLALGIFRSDYMDHRGEKFLQVEVNTIASGFGSLSTIVHQLHLHLVDYFGWEEYREYLCPDNAPLKKITEGLQVAVQAFVEREKKSLAAAKIEGEPVIVFVVEANERNAFDQFWLQMELWEKWRLRVVRLTMREIEETTHLSVVGQHLCLEDGRPIALCYFRVGYDPSQYSSPQGHEWNARLKMERSSAIKCPDVSMHLCTAKSIQQKLTEPGVLESLVDWPATAAEKQATIDGLRSTFARQYALPNGAGAAEAMAHARQDPHAYVLKPQREGGGHLYADEQMVKVLEEATPRELSAHVLMERIEPRPLQTWLMRGGVVQEGYVAWELGLFATLLVDMTHRDAVPLHSQFAGHLVRTKLSAQEDGGVAAGVAVLDSPALVPQGIVLSPPLVSTPTNTSEK
jgi:glutathione synthase